MKENNNILLSNKHILKKDNIKNQKYKYNLIFNKNYNRRTYNTIKIICIKSIAVIIIIFCFIIINKNKINRIQEFYQKIFYKNTGDIFNFSLKYDEYNETIDKNYKYLQNYFCDKPNENLNEEIENKIKKAKIDFKGLKFEMFVYKFDDIVSNSIIVNHQYEGNYVNKFLNALQFYSQKKKLDNKQIYFIDVGANIGCHSFLIGKHGYNVLSFEANKINNYILYKNFCLNKDVNLTIINKGLDEEEKICKLKISPKNKGDGAIFCDNREQAYEYFSGEVYNNIELTTLSKYIKFLSKKNVALMKIDAEGYEGKIIKGGKEIIMDYHIPFIMFEFSVRLFKFHRTDILEFLTFLKDNGYKFSSIDFFSKKNISPEELIKYNNPINLFVVYEKFIE